ncbi:thiamine kinase-like enzyme [Alkalibacillus filiformis]|uniref:Thiamine kinase-like enzyme n=1 Tax=Alkalibacillus filiformis TaxID=200990 RepID=A0ABU0DWK6_9BACI|nr:phosphotransferase [Alkalibacillus filiformis]MDQ0352745.1 thiamine kinase-like enzyme [Alkalibacillus filiformis]
MLHYVKQYRKLKEAFNMVQPDLENGVYKTHLHSKRIVYKEDSEAEQFVSQLIKSDYSNTVKVNVKRSIERVLNWTNNGSNHKYKGGLLLLNRSGDIKVFSFKNQLTKTYFKDCSRFEAFEETINFFSPYFNTTILNIDQKQRTVMEQLINTQPIIERSFDQQIQVVEQVIEQYDQYLSSQHEKFYYINLDYYFDRFSNNSSINGLLSSLKTVVNQEELVPVVPMHSDLHFENMLLKGDELYLIDWEDCSNKIFYYDVLNIMFVEAFIRDDFRLIECYLNGQFDSSLIKLFQSCGLKFDPTCRDVYFYNYSIVRLESEVTLGESNIEDIIKAYQRFIDKFSGMAY